MTGRRERLKRSARPSTGLRLFRRAHRVTSMIISQNEKSFRPSSGSFHSGESVRRSSLQERPRMRDRPTRATTASGNRSGAMVATSTTVHGTLVDRPVEASVRGLYSAPTPSPGRIRLLSALDSTRGTIERVAALSRRIDLEDPGPSQCVFTERKPPGIHERFHAAVRADLSPPRARRGRDVPTGAYQSLYECPSCHAMYSSHPGTSACMVYGFVRCPAKQRRWMLRGHRCPPQLLDHANAGASRYS